jgi:hypothetical protein
LWLGFNMVMTPPRAKAVALKPDVAVQIRFSHDGGN